MSKRCIVCACCCLIFLAAACAGRKTQTLQLTYSPRLVGSILCDVTAVVEPVADDRPREAIGAAGETLYYPADRDVSQWVTDALRGEMVARGCLLRSKAAGSPFNPAYEVSGAVNELYLTKKNALTWQLIMELTFTVVTQSKELATKTVRGYWERAGLPADKLAVAMLDYGLSELLAQALPSIVNSIEDEEERRRLTPPQFMLEQGAGS